MGLVAVTHSSKGCGAYTVLSLAVSSTHGILNTNQHDGLMNPHVHQKRQLPRKLGMMLLYYLNYSETQNQYQGIN